MDGIGYSRNCYHKNIFLPSSSSCTLACGYSKQNRILLSSNSNDVEITSELNEHSLARPSSDDRLMMTMWVFQAMTQTEITILSELNPRWLIK